MKLRQIVVGSVAALSVAVLTAACSSSAKSNAGSGSGGGSTSSNASAASNSSPAPTGTPIKIGNIGSYSGQAASSEAGAEDVLKAWASSVNDSGGINGHPVDLIVKDLGDNVTGGLAAAKELVQQDKVVAIVSDVDNGDTTWSSYIAGTGVPVIGGLSVNIPFATNPDFFPSGTNIFAAIYGEMVAAKTLGGKFDFLYCAESPQCASSVPLIAGIAKAVGVAVPVSEKVSATAPDYTSLCQQVKSSGAQSYQVGSASAVIVRVATACAAAGVTAKQITTDLTANSQWASTPALAGAQLIGTDFPFISTTGAGPQAYQALLAKYLPNFGAKNGPDAGGAYAAAMLFQKAAEGAGGTVTASSLKTALYAMKGETLGGLTPPLTFTSGQPTQVNCYFSLGLDSGKFTDPNPGATQCAPDALVGGIISQLSKS